MSQQIQLRGGTASEWTAANPILAAREMAVETDTHKYKIGDGTTRWNSLAYGGAALASKIETDLDMAALSGDPASPASGRMRLYVRKIAGRMLLKTIGPSGLDVALQPSLFGNSARILMPGTGTAGTVQNWVAPTAVGTVSNPVIAAGGFRVGCRRLTVTSAATANSASELRSNVYDVLRGDVAGCGGFHLVTTFGVESVTALQRVFVGLIGATGATATTQVPSSLMNCIGIGWDSADTTLQIMYNDGVSVCTKVPLSESFPANNASAVYQLDLFAPPAASWVGWRVKRLDTGDVAEGTMVDNLPASSQLLSWHANVNNGGTAAAVILSVMRTYLETDN